MTESTILYDVLVVGGGIAGMEASLTLGDMGYKVLLVEKECSIGGKMVLLSKVFPTLDCASCIATPKMAATANHENITVLPYSEVDEIVKENGHFHVRLHRKPTFVDSAACTGCGQCELVCTVAIPDQFNKDLIVTAAHLALIPARRGLKPTGMCRWYEPVDTMRLFTSIWRMLLCPAV
jgi:heterodisulfide reductase subunit A-like polyferredoxin